MKKSQKQKVIQQLREKGFVSRNWAVYGQGDNPGITRLGALIGSLKKQGYEFTTETRGKTEGKEGDFVYKLIRDPAKFDTATYKKEVVEERERELLNPKLF